LLDDLWRGTGWRERNDAGAHVGREPQPRSGAFVAAATACVILAALAAVAFVLHGAVKPHGEWDATAIWNLRARSIVRGAPDWPAIFSPAIGWSHPDYPILI